MYKKDKRGIAMITAIAVLALMLILFAGLAMVYSSQASRNKAELEESQAMLLAQSYAEMLDQVLTSTNEEADGLKEKLGDIQENREVEIESKFDNQPEGVIDSKVKIIATADRATSSGNTTTRKIKIKVSATVDDETRSIDLNYTFKKVIGGGVMDYAVYGNTVDYYKDDDDYDDDDEDDDDRQPINFVDTWYYYVNSFNESQVEKVDQLEGEYGIKYGLASGEKIFQIRKDTNIDPKPSGSSDLTLTDYNDFAIGVNKNDSTLTLPLWSGIPEPDDTVPECTNEITSSCIWDNSLSGGVYATAVDGDIVIYMPVKQNFNLKDLTLLFNGKNPETGEINQLYIYIYQERENAHNNNLTIDYNVAFANLENNGRSEYLDIFVICNDEIKVTLEQHKDRRSPSLEAYFYLPKGTVKWETQIDKNNYNNRIRGCLIADKIVILGNKKKEFNRVGVDYMPPREIDGGGSSKKSITYRLNSYEEGGRS